jgi:hypothetical protein
MWAINGALSAAAVVLLVSERDVLRGVLKFADLLPAALAAIALALGANAFETPEPLHGLITALLLAASVAALAWVFSPGLRQALRR